MDWLGIPLLNELGLLFTNLLYTAPIGFILGFFIGKSGFAGKIRNAKLLGYGAILLGILTANFAWIFWLNLSLGNPLFSFNFAGLSASFDAAAEYDMGKIFGWQPAGFGLYAIWFLRAVVIVGMAKISVELGVTKKPFCENCGRWTDAVLVTSILDPSYNMEELITSLETGNFQMLTAMRNVDPNSRVKLKVLLHECNKCDDNFFLSIDKTSISKDEDGEERENVNSILKNLKINKQTFEELLEWRNKLTVKN
jgi:hypothetical protein